MKNVGNTNLWSYVAANPFAVLCMIFSIGTVAWITAIAVRGMDSEYWAGTACFWGFVYLLGTGLTTVLGLMSLWFERGRFAKVVVVVSLCLAWAPFIAGAIAESCG